ncbi:MAG: M48 family metallopeptidase [Deltaproteobacteria bacterium]|nr:M48 family metallopeptidase [Deltaproteobacteria bacterium]
MLGGSEILILLLAVAVLFVLPRVQRTLEQGVDEKALGDEAFAAISKRQRVLRLDEGEPPAILTRFAKVRQLRVRNYSVHVSDERGVNALALPGGIVLLTADLLALRRGGEMTKDELAAVLAHEMGHIELGHSRRQHVRSTMSAWATRLGPTPGGPLGRMAMSVGIGALQKRASRDAEKEADAWAADLLRDAGYDERALATFLARTAAWGTAGGLWSTHPSPALRIEALEAHRREAAQGAGRVA